MKNLKLKVFFDTKPLEDGHAVRGIGSYTRNLIEVLKAQKSVQLVKNIARADVIHYSYFDFFFNTLKLVKKPTVVTIFDTIPLIYPEHYQTGVKGKINFWRQKNKLKNIDAVLTISETSKKDIVRFLDVPPEKIHVVYLAPGREFRKLDIRSAMLEIRKKYNPPEEFILYVGDVNYNKNILGLLYAFSNIKNLPAQAGLKSNLKLILVGEAFKKQNLPETKLITQLIKKLGLEDKVLMPGFVSEEDLVKIYNLATVYCQPSFYEGFGLPVLEAMACGTPVVSARTQALVEIIGDSGVFIDPNSPSDIARGIKEALDTRSDLVKRGLVRAKEFSWEKTARRTIEVYKQVKKTMGLPYG